MQRHDHPLLAQSLGSQKTITSLHYGQADAAPKVYIQASLHAEEQPGMLTAYHLRALLDAAESANQITGEIVLVPVANPVGLAQRLDHKPMGRFELETSENFNRHYPDLATAVWPLVKGTLGPDGAANVKTVRAAMAHYLALWQPATELHSLRKTLLTLAHDADYVLDLHCDGESVLHFYTEEACWPALEPLSRLLGSQVALLAKNSGSGPFDECLSGVWWQLSQALQAAGMDAPLPQACHTCTIELRGEADVAHAWAQQDAAALYAFLQMAGAIQSQSLVHSAPALSAAVPPAVCQPTPLAGSQTLCTPVPGLVAFATPVGTRVAVGDLIAEVIDPVENRVHAVRAGVAGVFYARIRGRYVLAGGEIGKIAGASPFKTGQLLGA